jgi:DNA helicase-2/ATP-dependent DNA helicase PcrA
MSLEETRKALRSQTKVVCVVAPAGCGKTFEACKYALEVAESLATGEQVLFLAHTNAAVHEFRIRTRKLAPKVDASTIRLSDLLSKLCGFLPLGTFGVAQLSRTLLERKNF